MTTVIPFTPVATQAFQFSPVLDGNPYNGIVTWNMEGSRYYLNLFDLNGNRIFTLPLIGSVDAVSIATVSWFGGFVNVITSVPHGYTLWSTIPLTLSGMDPDVLNGTYSSFITGRNTFQFPLQADPGSAIQLGLVNYNINMVEGYFTNTSLVFRESSQQFEINPIVVKLGSVLGNVIGAGTGGGGGGGTTGKNFYQIIQAANLAINCMFTFDAGAKASYPGTGGTITDLSGNALNWNLNSMTFHGTAGNLSVNEYFQSDGTDFLSIVEANPAWVDAIHQSNAPFSAAALVYFPGHTPPGATQFCWMPIFSDTTSAQTEGVALAFYSWLQFSGGINYYTGHFQCDRFLLAGADDYQASIEWYPTSTTTPTPAGWYFVAASINPQTGVSTFLVNGVLGTSSGIMVGDTDTNPANTVLGTGDATQPFTVNGRIVCDAGWDIALSGGQLVALYNEFKKDRPSFGLP